MTLSTEKTWPPLQGLQVQIRSRLYGTVLFARSYKTGDSVFLVSDGTDNVDFEDLEELSKLDLQKLSGDWGKFRLRIRLTANDGRIDQIKDHLEGDVVSSKWPQRIEMIYRSSSRTELGGCAFSAAGRYSRDSKN